MLEIRLDDVGGVSLYLSESRKEALRAKKRFLIESRPTIEWNRLITYLRVFKLSE